MFLIDKYDIKYPWDVMCNHDIYKRLLKLETLYSWNNINDNSKDFDNLPNLLIHGKEGSGKKSLARLFLKRVFNKDIKLLDVKYEINGYGSTSVEVFIPQSLYHIEIHPTNSGLDKYLVQEVIKEYASKNVLLFNNTRSFKIIWIHNIEELSYYAQTALRCTMERFSKTCKFILTSKQLSKIIEPLRSRCLSIRIPLPSDLDLIRVLMNISLKEDKFLKIEDYNNIIKKSDNNIKLAIQYLEMKYYDIPIETSWKIYLKKLIKIFNKCLTNKISQDHINEIREILYKIFITNISGTNIIKELLNFILLNFKNDELTYDIINLCTNYENSLSKGKRTIIHLEAFIFSVLNLINKKFNKTSIM
jgi:replication factor C subunit 3/5